MIFPFTLKQPVIPVVNAARKQLFYPVRRLYCIGQNYESHAREMGGHTCKNNPFFFTKPADALVTLTMGPHDVQEKFPTAVKAELSIPYPSVTESYHHEVEMVVAIGPRQRQRPGKHIDVDSSADVQSSDGVEDADPLAYFNLTVEAANEVIYGYGVGLDMTRRDLQAIAKENGKPWDIAKGGDGCAVISPLVLARDLLARHPKLFESEDSPPVSAGRTEVHNGAAAAGETGVSLDLKCGSIYLSVNGNERQKGNMDCMVNTPAEIISILSKYVTLHAGDLIFTGTPAGVGPVRRGDIMAAGVEGIGEMVVRVV